MFAQWDYGLFQLINGWAGGESPLNPVMKIFSENIEYLFYAGIITYWFTRLLSNRRMVAEALCSAVVAMSISAAIGMFFYRDRPFVSHHVFQMIDHAANASFPSDHAIGGFVIATSIWLFRRKEGYVWLAVAAIIAFSRVWNGVHYPFDVVAGALIGILTSVSVHKLFKHSAVAQKWLSRSLSLYEKLEQKVWVRS
ncbi:undecaprenyl-diphosphatase [Paenibacillus piri]|uniref:Undecaprenyl-diphosphatase n=1 Tax=Paenibacillus piri TaxID=2547395 RepID=A0A4R5KTJ1_9BACL|nr:undecaprenyl-diphosphatase [Paenibacillus piri]